MKKVADIATADLSSERGSGKFAKVILVLACFMSSAVGAQEAKVTQLASKDLANLPGKVGQTFYEGPNDVHIVGRNASRTKPAKFLVFFVKEKGSPLLVPAN